MHVFGPGSLETALERATAGFRVWIWLLLSAAAGSAAIFLRVPMIVPLVQAALVWPVLWIDLRKGRPGAAVGHMLAWAVMVSIIVIEISIHSPQAAAEGVLAGSSYRDEMFRFIRTGRGPEGDPGQFIPQHILHYALTLGASLISVGFAGLAMGCVLLNYMNFYVGALVLEGSRPVLGSLFGWPVWSILRVIGFVCGSIAAADFFLARILGRAPWNPADVRRLFLWSVGLFLADIVLKALLAEQWRGVLERALLP